MWIQVASPVSDWMPMPPGSPALEAPSPQSRDALLNEIAAEPPRVIDRYMERLTPVTVELAGIELRSNAINPRRKLLALVLPAKK